MLVLKDPSDWYRDLQLILDVVLSSEWGSCQMSGASTHEEGILTPPPPTTKPPSHITPLTTHLLRRRLDTSCQWVPPVLCLKGSS